MYIKYYKLRLLVWILPSIISLKPENIPYKYFANLLVPILPNVYLIPAVYIQGRRYKKPNIEIFVNESHPYISESLQLSLKKKRGSKISIKPIIKNYTIFNTQHVIVVVYLVRCLYYLIVYCICVTWTMYSRKVRYIYIYIYIYICKLILVTSGRLSTHEWV